MRYDYTSGGVGNTTVCSNAFGLRISGNDHTTTAENCNHQGYESFNSAGGTYGTSSVVTSSAAGRIMSSEGSRLEFHGDRLTTTRRLIQGWVGPMLNMLVCASGRNSGIHCGLRVMDNGLSYAPLDGASHNWTGWRATSEDPLAAAVVQGDSGGPVIRRITGDFTYVRASGMIQAGNFQRTCPPRNFPFGQCFGSVVFSRFSTLGSGAGGTLISY